MKIDTSTTTGKIELMQEFQVNGKEVQAKDKAIKGEGWFEPSFITWNWDGLDYRIKPQTVEEAAEECSFKYFDGETHNRSESFETGFCYGVKWRDENPKDQDNE